MKKILFGILFALSAVAAQADGLASGGPLSIVFAGHIFGSASLLGITRMPVNDGGNYLTDCDDGNLVTDLGTEEGKQYFDMLKSGYATQENMNIDYVLAPVSELDPLGSGDFCKIVGVYKGTL